MKKSKAEWLPRKKRQIFNAKLIPKEAKNLLDKPLPISTRGGPFVYDSRNFHPSRRVILCFEGTDPRRKGDSPTRFFDVKKFVFEKVG